MKKNIIASLLLISSSMSAYSANQSGTITTVLTDGTRFGGCMIQLSQDIGGTCKDNWVSLDCQGKFSGGGDRNYSNALLAFSLNKTVKVHFNGVQQHDGYCSVYRVDVLQ